MHLPSIQNTVTRMLLEEGCSARWTNGGTVMQVLIYGRWQYKQNWLNESSLRGSHICAVASKTKIVYSTIAAAVDYAYYALLVNATCIPTCGYVIICIERTAVAIELSGLKWLMRELIGSCYVWLCVLVHE